MSNLFKNSNMNLMDQVCMCVSCTGCTGGCYTSGCSGSCNGSCSSTCAGSCKTTCNGCTHNEYA